MCQTFPFEKHFPKNSFIITTEARYLLSRSGEVYTIQYYVIKFVSDLHVAVLWFSPGTPVFCTNKTDSHDITEILLNVTLNIITLWLSGTRISRVGRS